MKTETNFENALLNVVDILPISIIIFDNELNVIYSNKYTETIFGYTNEEILGKNLSFFLPEKFKKSHSNHVSDYMKNPTARPMYDTKMSFLARHAKNYDFPVQISLNPIVKNGKTNIIASILDMTQISNLVSKIDNYSLENDQLKNKIEKLTNDLEKMQNRIDLILKTFKT